MLGSIIGDIAGSSREFDPVNSDDFELFDGRSDFTDDTVCTVAIADALINKLDIEETLYNYCNHYPDRGYGIMFQKWIDTSKDKKKPYNSYGNGSAMRVSPVGVLFETIEETMAVAKQTAEVTHNHPEGIKGAQAVASCIYYAKHKKDKKFIKEFVEKNFGYNLSEKYSHIKQRYTFDSTCQGSVPEAIISFLESNDYEDAIRKAISLRGDADTQACITGGIAEAYYENIPEWMKLRAGLCLPDRFIGLIEQQYSK